jgi:hypothetical protein
VYPTLIIVSLQLQEKKSAMIDATLSTDDQVMGRLTPEDVSFSCFKNLNLKLMFL